MKKTLIASAIAVAALHGVNAQADIVITNMFDGGGNNAAAGTLTDAGDGNLYSIDPFLGISWTASQQTGFMDSTGTWNGVSEQGAFDYDTVIAGMSDNQRAVGLFFDWNGNNDSALLEIFDCVAGVCTGNGVPLANGPFVTDPAIPVFLFSGTGTAHAPEVPIPAAVWLFGSGLAGLLVSARRKRKLL